MQRSPIKALLFDVFGTVVDYRSSIIREGETWNHKKGINIDWPWLVDEWRGRYRPNMNRVLNGELPWMNLDALHRMALTEILDEIKIKSIFTEQEIDQLNQVWHRLEPWSDSVPGLTRLKQRYIIGPLSNGNISLLTNMAKNNGLPWDLILSPELVKSYKPNPYVYRKSIEYLGLLPHEVMMVAAHQYDLLAAKEVGLKTAYILRPFEYGIDKIPNLIPETDYDYIATDLVDLASQLED